MKIKQETVSGRFSGLRRLALNKWSLTIAVMLLMLSVYVTVEQPQDVLYVNDTLPYQVEKVSGTGDLQVLPEQVAGDNQPEDNDEPGERYSIQGDSDFFINYRMEREKARARQLELLQGVIDDSTTTDEVRREAQTQVLAQAEAIEQELLLESILVARYGGDAAVLLQGGKANVVLLRDADAMSDTEAEKIAALVDSYTGLGIENVVVVLKD